MGDHAFKALSFPSWYDHVISFNTVLIKFNNVGWAVCCWREIAVLLEPANKASYLLNVVYVLL